jgi:hypothetical protein
MVSFRRIAALLLFGVLLSASLSTASDAPALAASELDISAQPLSGPAGTTVTVTGRGATPYASLEIGGGYREYPEGCAGGIKGGQGNIEIFAQATADGAGNFTASFRVLPGGSEYTYAYFSAFHAGTYTGQSSKICFDITGNSHTFPETGKTVRGSFYSYWQEHGGLALNGYPISDAFTETLENGQSYQVQYFERVRLEFHDDLSVEPQILLGAFGRRIHPADPAVPAVPGATYFAATGHNVTRPAFVDYWNANGGLAQFGYPLSEEFDEVLEDGQTYRVQYFERARFEYHPEHDGTPYEVQLGQFGRAICGDRCR